VPGLSQEDRECIAYRNAERLLGLGLRPAGWQPVPTHSPDR
jgi:hypothetical protein